MKTAIMPKIRAEYIEFIDSSKAADYAFEYSGPEAFELGKVKFTLLHSFVQDGITYHLYQSQKANIRGEFPCLEIIVMKWGKGFRFDKKHMNLYNGDLTSA